MQASMGGYCRGRAEAQEDPAGGGGEHEGEGQESDATLVCSCILCCDRGGYEPGRTVSTGQEYYQEGK